MGDTGPVEDIQRPLQAGEFPVEAVVVRGGDQVEAACRQRGGETVRCVEGVQLPGVSGLRSGKRGFEVPNQIVRSGEGFRRRFEEGAELVAAGGPAGGKLFPLAHDVAGE